MTDIETEIEPPGLDFDEDDDDDEGVSAYVGVTEMDGTRRAGYGHTPGDATDTEVATMLVDCLVAAAAARGPGLSEAVRREMRSR